jgi:hypothetical protein
METHTAFSLSKSTEEPHVMFLHFRISLFSVKLLMCYISSVYTSPQFTSNLRSIREKNKEELKLILLKINDFEITFSWLQISDLEWIMIKSNCMIFWSIYAESTSQLSRIQCCIKQITRIITFSSVYCLPLTHQACSTYVCACQG